MFPGSYFPEAYYPEQYFPPGTAAPPFVRRPRGHSLLYPLKPRTFGDKLGRSLIKALILSLILASGGCSLLPKPQLPSLDDVPTAQPGQAVFRPVSLIESMNPLGPWFMKAGQEIVPVARAPRTVTREELEAGIRSDIESEREAAERRGREQTWGQLKGWASLCFVPGIILLVGSRVAPELLGSLGKVGLMLTIGGVGLALTPWLGSMLAPSLVGYAKVILGAGMFGGAVLLAYRLWVKIQVERRVSELRQEIELAQKHGDTERAKLLASAVIALERTEDSSMDKGQWKLLPEGQIINGHKRADPAHD